MSEKEKSLLSPTQKNLVGIAVGLLALTFIGAFFFSLFLLLRGFVEVFSGVLWPLATAGILALILRPVVEYIDGRTALNRKGSIVVLYVLVLLVIGVVATWVVPLVFSQALRFVEYFPMLADDLRNLLSKQYPEIEALLARIVGTDWLEKLKALLNQNVGQIAEVSLPALEKLKMVVGETLAWSAGFAIIPVYLFFFLETRRDVTEDLREQLSFLKEDWRDDAIFLTKEFIGSIVAFFRGQMIIALLMGILLAIGFSLAGVNFAILLGLGFGFLNVIPYLGSIIGTATILPLAYLQPEGGISTMAYAILTIVVVQIIEGYLLTPKIMGKTTGLHPLTIIIAIFFWGTALNGILGMILAIPLTAFFVVAWRLIRRKYLRDKVVEAD